MPVNHVAEQNMNINQVDNLDKIIYFSLECRYVWKLKSSHCGYGLECRLRPFAACLPHFFEV